jgi:hypothetical protein
MLLAGWHFFSDGALRAAQDAAWRAGADKPGAIVQAALMHRGPGATGQDLLEAIQ